MKRAKQIGITALFPTLAKCAKFMNFITLVNESHANEHKLKDMRAFTPYTFLSLARSPARVYFVYY